MELNRFPIPDSREMQPRWAYAHSLADDALGRVQQELFDVGAECSCPPEGLPEQMSLISDGKKQMINMMDGNMSSNFETKAKQYKILKSPVRSSDKWKATHAKTILQAQNQLISFRTVRKSFFHLSMSSIQDWVKSHFSEGLSPKTV